jgi:hypothetical protein
MIALDETQYRKNNFSYTVLLTDLSSRLIQELLIS